MAFYQYCHFTYLEGQPIIGDLFDFLQTQGKTKQNQEVRHKEALKMRKARDYVR